MIAPICHLFLHLLILTHSRLNICYAVQHLSQYIQGPWTSYFSAALRVLQYLRNNPSQGLFLTSDLSVKLVAFAMQIGDRVSICIDQSVDFLSLLEAHLFLGSQKEQVSISLSSAGAEYRSMRRVVADMTWLNCLLADMGSPTLIYSHFVRKTIPRTPDFSVLCSGFFSGRRSLPQIPIWAISPHRSRQIGDLSLPVQLEGVKG